MSRSYQYTFVVQFYQTRVRILISPVIPCSLAFFFRSFPEGNRQFTILLALKVPASIIPFVLINGEDSALKTSYQRSCIIKTTSLAPQVSRLALFEPAYKRKNINPEDPARIKFLKPTYVFFCHVLKNATFLFLQGSSARQLSDSFPIRS